MKSTIVSILLLVLFGNQKANAQWSEVGGVNSLSANDQIHAVGVAGANVYAAGEFVNASSRAYVAKWNGTAWSELGGTNGLSAYSWIQTLYVKS